MSRAAAAAVSSISAGRPVTSLVDETCAVGRVPLRVPLESVGVSLYASGVGRVPLRVPLESVGVPLGSLESVGCRSGVWSRSGAARESGVGRGAAQRVSVRVQHGVLLENAGVPR